MQGIFLKNIIAFCQVWGENIFEVQEGGAVLLFWEWLDGLLAVIWGCEKKESVV